MDLAQLKIFAAVVEHGGITPAARALHRVQSNVTTRVRQLEEEMGVDLFVREGKKLHLTPKGSVLLDYAKRILTLAEEAQEAVNDRAPKGTLKLGSMESAAMVRLPIPLSVYNKAFPEVTIELRTGTTDFLLDLLGKGELDAALSNEPDYDVDFEKYFIYEDELVLVDRAYHCETSLDPDEEPGTVLAFEKGCMSRARLEDWFYDQNRTPSKFIELNSYSTIFSCVIAGMGVTVVPRKVVDTFPAQNELEIRSLPKHLRKVKTYLYWRRGMSSPKIEELISILKDGD